MKKKKYLMKIFMHLHAPLKERIQMVKDLRRSLDDKLAEGLRENMDMAKIYQILEEGLA